MGKPWERRGGIQELGAKTQKEGIQQREKYDSPVCDLMNGFSVSCLLHIIQFPRLYHKTGCENHVGAKKPRGNDSQHHKDFLQGSLIAVVPEAMRSANHKPAETLFFYTIIAHHVKAGYAREGGWNNRKATMS
jgi:hypothetical protein